jgi:hypothetical protein
MIALILFCMAELTRAPFRKRRFRFVVLEVRMWLFIAWFRFTLPEPVNLKRLLAPR